MSRSKFALGLTQSDQPGSLQILREMRAELASKDDVKALATKGELSALRSELKWDMRSLRADIAADVVTTRKELSEQTVGLRRAVIEYHTSIVGHGVLISDLEARVRRVEQHLNLPPTTAS